MSVNLWQRFKGTLPGTGIRIGTITQINSGTVTVSLASGGSLVVRGTGTLADTVFILDGEVRSSVSGLSTFSPVDV